MLWNDGGCEARWAHKSWFNPPQQPGGRLNESKWSTDLAVDVELPMRTVRDKMVKLIEACPSLRSTVAPGNGDADSLTVRVNSPADAIDDFLSSEGTLLPAHDSASNVRVVSELQAGVSIRLAHGLIDGWGSVLLRSVLSGLPIDEIRNIDSAILRWERSSDGQQESDKNVAAILHHSTTSGVMASDSYDWQKLGVSCPSLIFRSTRLASRLEVLSKGLRVSQASVMLGLFCWSLRQLIATPSMWISVLCSNRRTRDEILYPGIMMGFGSALIEIARCSSVDDAINSAAAQLRLAAVNVRHDPHELRTQASSQGVVPLSPIAFHFRDEYGGCRSAAADVAPRLSDDMAWGETVTRGGFPLALFCKTDGRSVEGSITTNSEILTQEGVRCLLSALIGRKP